MNMLFDEQFNGTSLDTTKWRTCFHNSMINATCCNHDQSELEIYCPQNVSVSNGTLKLTATRDASGQYYSGMIMSGPGPADPNSKFTFLYGHVEMRARIPAGKGLWPAFWLLDPNQYPPEIDIMEVLGDATTVYGTFHPSSGGQSQGQTAIANLYTDWHTYALDWFAGLLIWYVDGREYHRVTQGVPSSPMYILANLAVGGDWPGNPDASTKFPTVMEVDSITVSTGRSSTMITWGIDYSEGYDIATMQKWNVRFACRYIGYTSPSLPQTKILTLQEAQALSHANIGIVSNWEYTGDPSREDGVWAAQTADARHRSLGGPPDRPIYFSYDKSANFINGVLDAAQYYRDVASVIGLQRTGAYGPYDAIKWLLDNGLITWAWQTYAWSGGQFDTRSHIYQYANGMQLDNMVADYDNAFPSDFGQWMIETPIQLQGDIPMHFETRQGLNDRTFFSTGGKALTLSLGCDFGTASVRVATKVANQTGLWHVNTYTVNSINDPVTVSIDTAISQVSVVVSNISSPDTIVGVDAA